MMDLLLFNLLLNVVLTYVYPRALDLPHFQYNIIVIGSYMFLELYMLAYWGATPGKALLKVKVRNRDGSKLSIRQASERSVAIMTRGLAVGAIIIEQILEARAYFKLKKEGITSWDKKGDFFVTHGTIGWWRAAVAILFLSAVGLLQMLYLLVELHERHII